MKTFVDRIASYVFEHELSLENLHIIVPSQRMITYLHRALYSYDNKPKLAPKIQTIDTWMNQLVELPVIEKSQLLFELYDIFSKNPIEQENNSFDAFLTWGQILLSDFDEIDRYLVDPNQLFKNLKDVKEIEMWSFDSEELSLGQQKFMAFWDKLGPYYLALKERLKSEGKTTKGGVYRTVAEEIDRVFRKNKDAVFLFAGFNAMSESELSILKQLHKLGKAHILMDSDTFYLNDSLHEAGSFQRLLLERLELKSLPFVSTHLATKSVHMEVVECAQITGQANVISTKLAALTQTELDETVVLLADESLLPTLLQHLPASIGKANITLGLPLRNTSLRLWVDLIFRLQESFIRRGHQTIYYKDYIQLVHHPFFLGILTPSELTDIRKLETKIVANNWHFIQEKELHFSEQLKELNALLFLPWQGNWNRAMQAILAINTLLDSFLSEKSTLEKASIRTFSEVLIPLQNALQLPHPVMNLGTFKNLFAQQWNGESLAYFGNPLDGVQIMGLLETRGLDFKRLFVIGLNEGTMPPNNPIRTIIPMDLRSYYGLPTPREKQGLFAHHFYRLLHLAEEITITFTSADQVIGSNEPSRFIQQMELELKVENPNFTIDNKYYTLGNEEKVGEVSIAKTPEIIERMDELLADGLSFSKLSAFLKCPLNFYYRYVLRMGEENKVEEEIENNTLGTVIHEVMEFLFSDFAENQKGQNVKRNTRALNVDDFIEMKKRAPLLISAAFENNFTSDLAVLDTGTNHINFIMVSQIVDKILTAEMQKLKENPTESLFIKGTELEVEARLKIGVNGVDKNVYLNGIIDRVDTWKGKTRIIDYKSGALDEKKVKISFNDTLDFVESLIKLERGKPKNHILQLITYSYLYEVTTGRSPDETGIFSFLNISESPFLLQLNKPLEPNQLKEVYEETLRHILEEMYDESLPFEHNKDAQYCIYCKA